MKRGGADLDSVRHRRGKGVAVADAAIRVECTRHRPARDSRKAVDVSEKPELFETFEHAQVEGSGTEAAAGER